MAEILALKAEKRELSGKGVARALRRNGQIPAIIYGNKTEEVSISTNLKELQKEYLRGNFTSRLYQIEIGKEKITVLPRDVQLHPVTDVVMHADFQRVQNDSKVHVLIPVHFLNRDKSPGLKRGGVLSIVRRQVELWCRADSIPEYLEVDLENVKIGESLHSHNIKYPEGVEPAIKDRDFTIAAIVGKKAETEEAAEAEGDAE
jgi:large subunit ribosomal protein L25